MAEDLSRIFLQEYGDLGLRDSSLRDADDEVVESIFFGADFFVVQTEKGDGAGECRPLVAVEKRMIAADVKEVRSRHLVQAFVKKCAAEGRHRRGYGRLKPFQVAPPEDPAVLSDAILVDC